MITTNDNPLDTAQAIEELKGLLSLSESNLPNTVFTVKKVGVENDLSLSITPQLSDEHQDLISTLLDTIIENPATQAHSSLRLFFNETSPEIVDLLKLDTINGYPFEIDYASARWGYEERESFMTGPLAGSTIIAYLDYTLKKAIPLSSYTLGLADRDQEDEGSAIVSSLFENIGPLSSSFLISGANERVEQLWDSMRNDYRVTIDSVYLSLRWADIDIPYRKFSKSIDQDTVIAASITNLLNAKHHVYHALIAPQLSSVITGYRFEIKE